VEYKSNQEWTCDQKRNETNGRLWGRSPLQWGEEREGKTSVQKKGKGVYYCQYVNLKRRGSVVEANRFFP